MRIQSKSTWPTDRATLFLMVMILCMGTASKVHGQHSYLSQFYPEVADTDTLLLNDFYTVSYSLSDCLPHWAIYLNSPSRLSGTFPRNDSFRSDSRITTCNTEGNKYRGSGYDRGHLVPAAAMRISEKAMSDCFLMTNISPQSPSLNRGAWRELEEWSRVISEQKQDSIVVLVGHGREFDLLEGYGPVPQKYFMVLIHPRKKKVIGFLLPNEARVLGEMEGFIMTIDEIERYAGFNLFASWPVEERKKLSEEVDWEFWGLSSPRDNEVTVQALVIGNDEYQSYPLQKASIDATKVGEAILSLGGSVEYGINVSGDSLKRMIQSFYGRSDDFDWNIFYNAGHGTQGELGMTMYGIDDDDAVAQVSLDYFLRPFALRSDEGSPQVAAFIDACRTGPGGIGAEQPAFVKVQFSTQGNQAAFDSEFKSVYARILAERLTENPPITLDSFLTGVTVRVYEETARLQMPQKHFGDLIGDRSLSEQHPYKKN